MIALSLLLVSSCAKEALLSETQKSEIVGTFESAGRAYAAARSNITVSSNTALSVFVLGLVSPAAPVDVPLNLNEAADPSLRQMMSMLRDKIKSKDCRVRFIAPSAFTSRSYQGVKRTFISFRVWGEQYCPVSLNFKIGTLLEPAIGRWAISYDYSYLVTDTAYRLLNDIDAVELHGGVSVNGIGTQRVRSETDIKGSVHSQSAGTIGLESFGQLQGANQNELSGEVTWRFSYAGYTAEFRRSYDSGKVSCSLNRESITESEFDQYFSRGGEPFLYGANSDLVH